MEFRVSVCTVVIIEVIPMLFYDIPACHLDSEALTEVLVLKEASRQQQPPFSEDVESRYGR